MADAVSQESRHVIDGTTPKEVLRDLKAAVRRYGDGAERPITPEERHHLELRLHRMLVWVGVLTPFEFELGGKVMPLHDIVWDLLAKDCLTDEEKESVRNLIYKLQNHERVDEEVLHDSQLTVAEADVLFKEASGLLRAILSLKTLVGAKNTCALKSRASQRRLEDAKYWLGFLKQIS